MLSWYQHFPQIIDPIAFTIGSFSVRWYALSYIVGFFAAYGVLMLKINRETEIAAEIFNLTDVSSHSDFKTRISNLITDFLIFAFAAAIIGGRIGYVLLYDFKFFLENPLQIISPFDAYGHYIGIFGMSYHGALISVIVMSWLFVKHHKISFWKFADLLAPAAAAGYFFGRIGNFLNGELFGRTTNLPIGMYFGTENSLRHPSQLYEALGEGILLFVLLWMLSKRKSFDGVIFAWYLIGYALIRFILEFMREPDVQIGFVFAGLTMGQILSIGLLICGVFIFAVRRRRNVV
jgi:phosphatidylglycerol:prolipoprotein diacylglycerol transferase